LPLRPQDAARLERQDTCSSGSGLLIFDDYQWKTAGPAEGTPKPAVDIFSAMYGKQLEVVHNGYQVILRKK
jgi:hypothetical protein